MLNSIVNCGLGCEKFKNITVDVLKKFHDTIICGNKSVINYVCQFLSSLLIHVQYTAVSVALF